MFEKWRDFVYWERRHGLRGLSSPSAEEGTLADLTNLARPSQKSLTFVRLSQKHPAKLERRCMNRRLRTAGGDPRAEPREGPMSPEVPELFGRLVDLSPEARVHLSGRSSRGCQNARDVEELLAHDTTEKIPCRSQSPGRREA